MFDFDLIYAVQTNDIERVKLLLEEGADVHIRNAYALREASFYGYLEMIRLLLEHGANPEKLTNSMRQKLENRAIRDAVMALVPVLSTETVCMQDIVEFVILKYLTYLV